MPADDEFPGIGPQDSHQVRIGLALPDCMDKFFFVVGNQYVFSVGIINAFGANRSRYDGFAGPHAFNDFNAYAAS